MMGFNAVKGLIEGFALAMVVGIGAATRAKSARPTGVLAGQFFSSAGRPRPCFSKNSENRRSG